MFAGGGSFTGGGLLVDGELPPCGGFARRVVGAAAGAGDVTADGGVELVVRLGAELLGTAVAVELAVGATGSLALSTFKVTVAPLETEAPAAGSWLMTCQLPSTSCIRP